jgi:gamma-glutamyltranspeptidase/glutathione hydrolase
MIATRTEVAAENGVVVGGHALEAEAGVRILQEGGNAIDALVTAAFVGFVVEPASCGMGGYGRLSIFLGDRREFVTIDHYVRAPHKAHAAMFEVDASTAWHYYGHPKTAGLKAETGYLSAAVPGAVAGLCTAHEMFGKLPLAQVLAPAIEIAEQGVPVSWSLVLYISSRFEEIKNQPHLANFLLRNGNPPQFESPFSVGDRLDAGDLAKTLRLIAQHGPAAFYSGPIAEAIEREFARHGGILNAADLAAYRPKIMREKPVRYRAYDYITAYDQVSYETLNILDHFDLAGYGPDSLQFRHLAAEAMGHAFMDNQVHYGDPDYTRSPVNGLSSRAFAAKRAAAIRLDRAAARPIAPGNPWPYESTNDAPDMLPSTPTLANPQGTSQMATADRDGNMTALITSLSNVFGSLILVPTTGIILNNSMQNFDPRPDHPNCIAPGKMPIFAAPSLVAAKDGRAAFAGCGSGGYRILSGVLHPFIHVVEFGMSVQMAVDAPRVHCQGNETYVDARIPAEVQDKLAALGHNIIVVEDKPGVTNFGRVNAIWVDPQTGLMHAGSGPAWLSAAAGY